MILLIDNYDSFTFNLFQYFGELGEEIVVRRNDQITIEEIQAMNPEAICLSPGPGRPENAGICVEVIKTFYKSIPILGICLGHQAIGYAFDANVVKAQKVMHGKVSKMRHSGTDLFIHFQQPIEIMRYHSLVIEKGTLNEDFKITGESLDDEEIMAIQHKEYPLYGLQFHPESVGTKIGKQLLLNFLKEIRKENKMKDYIQRLSERQSLSQKDMKDVIGQIFSDEITDSEIAALLIGLKSKGETVEEIVGIVEALREHAMPFKTSITNVIDNCGTGGDGSKSFNISTTSAFVMAGAGIHVAKHGNRSITSKTGSADVLEYLGVNWNISPETSMDLLQEVGITFLFAPYVHPKWKRIMKVRKELRIPTVFNLIGPLTNPVELETQILGIYRRDLIGMFAEVLKTLGRKRAVVLNGAGYMDEASLAGENHLAILENGTITNRVLHPEELGFRVYGNESIRGGDSKENAAILLRVLKGEKGAYRDTVLLNAGIGIFTNGLTSTMEEGVKLAAESIDSGAALGKLQQLVEKTKAYRAEVI